MKPYKVVHKPTGLFYQPHKYHGSNLSKRGKIYQTSSNGLSEAKKMLALHPDKKQFQTFRIYVEKNSTIHIMLKDIFNWEECKWQPHQLSADTNVSDWEYVAI